MVWGLEPALWPLASNHPEYRELSLVLARWWTVKRSLVILQDRSGHHCEVCGERLSGITDPHHVFERDEYRGPFRDHPGNLVVLHRRCHDDVHAGDKDIERRLKELALGRLPDWFQEVEIFETRAAIKDRRSPQDASGAETKAFVKAVLRFFGLSGLLWEETQSRRAERLRQVVERGRASIFGMLPETSITEVIDRCSALGVPVPADQRTEAGFRAWAKVLAAKHLPLVENAVKQAAGLSWSDSLARDLAESASHLPPVGVADV